MSKYVQSVSWHSSIRRSSLVRRRNGTQRRVLKTQYKHLYDGLHGDSEIKARWFKSVVGQFEREIEHYILANHRDPSSMHVEIES